MEDPLIASPPKHSSSGAHSSRVRPVPPPDDSTASPSSRGGRTRTQSLLTSDALAELAERGGDSTPATTSHPVLATSGGDEASPLVQRNNSHSMDSQATPRRRSKATEASTGNKSSREPSTSSRREPSTGRRPGAGHVRELFRVKMQMQHVQMDEELQRMTIIGAEALGFAWIFQQSSMARLLSSEALQRAMLAREEEPPRLLLKRQLAAGLEAMRVEEEKERQKAAGSSFEVNTGDNRLYDRILRKRAQMGLSSEDPLAKTKATTAKLDHANQQAAKAADEEYERMAADVKGLDVELQKLSELLASMSSSPKKERRAVENEMQQLQDRKAKICDMMKRHEEHKESERRRAERADTLRGVDKEVLKGKKSILSAKMERDSEVQRKKYEEEIEIALRRALQNEKAEAPAVPSSGAASGRTGRSTAAMNSSVPRLPSIQRDARSNGSSSAAPQDEGAGGCSPPSTLNSPTTARSDVDDSACPPKGNRRKRSVSSNASPRSVGVGEVASPKKPS